MSSQQYKDLGCANGWSKMPSIVKEAREKGYREREVKLGNCYYEYFCDELGYRYRVDCSD